MTVDEEYSHLLFQIACDVLEWCKVFLQGGSSPTWTDGRELNYLREKIRRDREELTSRGFDAESVLDLPPEMDVFYMKNCEEIERKAVQTLERYQKDEDYCYLVEHLDFLGNIQKACMKNNPDDILKLVVKLENAIEEKDYVAMRKYSQGEYGTKKLLEKIKKCRKEMEIEIEDMNPF